MTASIPRTVHEELALLDEIERELAKLTTADLEGSEPMSTAALAPLASTSAVTAKTVIPAQAGPHNK